MKFSAQHLKRYREIGRLRWKYGRSDLVKAPKDDTDVIAPEEPSDAGVKAGPEEFVRDLEAMGPTYVKFGQVLAGRPDLLPKSYLTALARLQDSVKPISGAEAMAIVEQELQVRISKAFSRFDPEPVAAGAGGAGD